MKKAIFRMTINMRGGRIEGVFTCTQQEIDILISEKIEVYFGEILGKHSEIFGSLEKEHFQKISDQKEVVEMFEKYDLNTGYNPFKQTSINFKLNGKKCHDIEIRDIIKEILKSK